MTTRSCCVVLVSLGFVVIGCGTPVPMDCWADGGVCDIGDSCRSDADCASGACVEGACAEPPQCETHADCAGDLYCVQTMVDGAARNTCSATCGEDQVLVEDGAHVFVCVEGEVVDCGTPDEYAEGAQCNVCGCPTGSYCLDEVFACGDGTPCSCRPQKAFGESCQVHQDCESLNCSGSSASPNRYCQLAAGESCDPNADPMQCQWCWQEPSGDSFCKQSCVRDTDCPDGGHCLGADDPNVKACWADCTESETCPEGYACTQITMEGDAACLPMAPG